MSDSHRLQSPMVSLDDDFELAFDYMYAQGWTDGLPVVPPTEARVRRMLEAVDRDPAEVIGDVPPANGKATIEKIAVNAVMTGCRPEYLPVVIAAVEGVLEPSFNLHGIQATTNPAGPGLIINGPIRKELGVNCGRNCLGQGTRANATMGRAVRFVLTNIGGGIPGDVDKAVLGWPGKYTLCFGENEEESPWEPLHVERGFRKDDSTVTVVAAASYNNVCCAYIPPGDDSVIRLIADAFAYMGNVNMRSGRGHSVAVLTPGDAKVTAALGFTKHKVKEYVMEHCGIPLKRYPKLSLKENSFGGHGWTVIGDRTYPFDSPQNLLVVVAGGPEPYYAAVVTVFPSAISQTKLVRAGKPAPRPA